MAKRRWEVLPAQATIAWGGELWGEEEEEALEDTARRRRFSVRRRLATCEGRNTRTVPNRFLTYPGGSARNYALK